MKLVKWTITVVAGVLSIGALSGIAAAQVPLDQLPRVLDASMPRDEQMSIALSACPKGVATNATVYVLGPKGYEIARQGTNGASALVGRHFETPNETTVEPMCYDPEGSKTLLQVELHEEELRSRGVSQEEIGADTANGYKDGRFKAPSRPGILYMLSSDNRLGLISGDGTGHFPPHMMFFAPYMTGKDLGYGSSVAPFLVNAGKPNALMVVIPDLNPKMN